jgi:hypothetical protein
MPLTRCEDNGKPGWKFGDTGKCYVYTAGDDASEKDARRKAVKQALAIGGGTPPADLADVMLSDDVDDETILALATGDDLPDGVVRCTMGGVSGFRGDGGPTSACHVHDGSPAGMRSAIAKALRDRGNAGGPPTRNADRALADGMLETVDIPGVDLLSTGGPIHGTGSPAGGDYFDEADLRAIADANRELADEVKIPIKIGHSRSQKLLKGSGLYSDEMPAGGWVENIRVSGGKILGDYKRVPRKLAELMKAGAFRARSVEISRLSSQTKGGKQYPSVITAVALLGAKAPAVRTLDDILAWYSEDDDRDPSRDVAIDDYRVEPILVYMAAAETEATADTSGMDTADSTTQAPTLTDDQVASFATAFGIEEEDAEARRAAVLAKFSEFAPTATSPNPAPEPTPAPPTPAPTPTTPPSTGESAPSVEMVAIPRSELDELRADAKAGRSFADAAGRARIEQSLDLAIKQGRLAPSQRADFLAFGEREPEMMLNTLVSLPVQEKLLRVYGSDADGDADGAAAADDAYRAYAAATGVPVRSVTTTQGGQQ